jgi:hypothetical protein
MNLKPLKNAHKNAEVVEKIPGSVFDTWAAVLLPISDF